MMNRCYNKKVLKRQPTYKDKYVCEEWRNFQNFAKWFDENYYECDGERMELDKDILCKGNKIYSPDTCVFVPRKINQIFNKNQNIRGEYPIGVRFRKDCNKYETRCSMYDYKTSKYKIFHIGYFKTVEEAFDSYKEFKERYIKNVANIYKKYIPQNLYEALYLYSVEIND